MQGLCKRQAEAVLLGPEAYVARTREVYKAAVGKAEQPGPRGPLMLGKGKDGGNQWKGPRAARKENQQAVSTVKNYIFVMFLKET